MEKDLDCLGFPKSPPKLLPQDEMHSPCLTSFVDNFSALRTYFRWDLCFSSLPTLPRAKLPPPPTIRTEYDTPPLWKLHTSALPSRHRHGCMCTRLPSSTPSSFRVQFWGSFYPYLLEQCNRTVQQRSSGLYIWYRKDNSLWLNICISLDRHVI